MCGTLSEQALAPSEPGNAGGARTHRAVPCVCAFAPLVLEC